MDGLIEKLQLTMRLEDLIEANEDGNMFFTFFDVKAESLTSISDRIAKRVSEHIEPDGKIELIKSILFSPEDNLEKQCQLWMDSLLSLKSTDNADDAAV